ncbi:energy transducer TonB [Mucilaginibacter sp. AW1-3]
MAIHNVNIYGDEWIELVFENRNKSYGAYELRKHYASTVLKALAVTFGSIAVVAYCAFLLFKPAPIAAHPITHEVNTVLQSVNITNRPVVRPRHTHHHTRTGQTYSSAPEVAVRQTTTQPSTTVTTTAAVSQASIPDEATSHITVVENKEVYPINKADIKPLPVGGAQGWASYLQKNLVYPEAARHEKISGKVELSFIVEKDGSISDITIDQPAGHGFDEEAVRVLKASPLWQAGIKDGEPIRIRYRLPITFQMVH